MGFDNPQQESSGYDSTLRVLSLEPESCLDRVSMQVLPASPSAVRVCEINNQLYLFVGLQNGVLLRTNVDVVTGGLSDTRSRFLGPQRVGLSTIKLQGRQAVLALGSKPHVCYGHMNQYCMTPLSYEALEHANAFSSTQCFEGIVAIKGKELRIIQVERLGETFTQRILKTKYTPTKMQVNPRTKHLFLIEKDYNCYTET